MTKKKAFIGLFILLVAFYLIMTIPNIMLQYQRGLSQATINSHIIYDYGMFFAIPLIFLIIFYDNDLIKGVVK